MISKRLDYVIAFLVGVLMAMVVILIGFMFSDDLYEVALEQSAYLGGGYVLLSGLSSAILDKFLLPKTTA